MNNNSNNKELDARVKLGETLFNLIIQYAIAHGSIDISNLSDDQIKEKYITYISKLIEKNPDIDFIIVHKENILAEARRLVLELKFDLALVVYATWWEHWVNGILATRLFKKNIVGKEFKTVIQNLNLRSKTTWFLKLVDLPPFEENHLKQMNLLSEKRNSFVHYKYQPQEEVCKDKFNTYFEAVEESIEYFNKYENKLIFQSFKKVSL
ncbi:hypothetical protein DENIS_2919 [Desulfonema ishimotonii]|uniref:RiboL-PSP-HEPN domain-containing protein n=1 Tax=Desulfonema ishimotonii TaxID=45657 RepID=A0A401FYB5_9BACT|nr:hypothetical protein [Desulfonema ishimotonii]GBC61957.1 hypothetical protein DENIS_2919 [Desulfonema ishimotonii]